MVKFELILSSPAHNNTGPWATMTLENAVFVDPNGGEFKIEKLLVGPVLIGWLPG